MCIIWNPLTRSLYLSLTAFHNYKLLLRRCPGKDNFCMMHQDVIQLLTSHVLQIWAMNYTSFGIPAIKRQYNVLLHKLTKFLISCLCPIKLWLFSALGEDQLLLWLNTNPGSLCTEHHKRCCRLLQAILFATDWWFPRGSSERAHAMLVQALTLQQQKHAMLYLEWFGTLHATAKYHLSNPAYHPL